MRYSFITTKPCDDCGIAVAARAMHHHKRSHEITRRIRKDANGCWTWTGSTSRRGYGQLQVNGHVVRAHRHVYGLMVGPIPAGMTLDHLCGNKPCVNPAHLEPVTARENWLRWRRTVPA